MSSSSSVSSIRERFVAPPVDPDVIRRAAEVFLDPRRDRAYMETTSDLLNAFADPSTEVHRGRSQTSRPRNNNDRSRSPRVSAPTRETRYRSPDGLQSRREQDTEDRNPGLLNQGVEDMDKDRLLEMIKKLQEEVEVSQKQGQAKHILDREFADAERIRSLEAELAEVRARSTKEPSEDGEVRENPESSHESEGSMITMTDAQIMHKVAFDITRAWFLSLNPDMEIDEDAYKEFDQQALRNLGQQNIHQHQEMNDEIARLKAEVADSQEAFDDKDEECDEVHRWRRQEEIAFNKRIEDKDGEVRGLQVVLQHVRVDSKKKLKDMELDGKKKDKEIRGLRAKLAENGEVTNTAKGKPKEKAKTKSHARTAASGSGSGTIAKATKATKALIPRPSAAGPVGVTKGTRNPPRSARFVGKYNLG